MAKSRVDQINEQYTARAAVSDKVQALADKETGGEQLTAEEVAEVTQLQTQFDEITASINRLEKAEAMAAATAKPITPYGQAEELGDKVYQQVKTPDVKGAKVARMVISMAAAKGNPDAAARFAANTLHDQQVAAALTTQTATGGGVLVPVDYRQELIELLRPESVVRSMNPIVLPMPRGNATIPKIVSGATAGYIGSDSDAGLTGQEFGDLQLSTKKLAALVPVSNDLLGFSSHAVEQIVISDLISALAERQDLAFIRGDGSNNTPKGLRFWAPPATHLITASDGATLAKVKADLAKLDLALRNANVKMRKPGYLMSPRTYEFLAALVDGNGNPAFPSLEDMKLKNRPVGITTQIPDNLGGGGDESEITLCDFSNAVIGEAESLEIAISTEATYTDTNGDTVSAFQRDQTLVRAIEQHDFGMRHDPSVAVLTGVNWTP